MRIGPQLVLMMSAVVAPVALLAGSSIFALGQSQRQVHAQRYLERVSALRLALDNEIQGTARVLEGLAFTGGVADGAAQSPREPQATLQRLLQSFPLWSAVGVIALDGRELAGARRGGGAGALALDAATLARAQAERSTIVSDLVRGPDGSFFTFVVTPVVRDGRVVSAVVAGIEHRAWLDFLLTYPVAEGATLTLNDRQGLVIARTLNPEQWVGKRSVAAFWDHTIGQQQGSFENRGLEGQRFHTAFSRLRTSGWVLGTGVPAATVEAALQLPALLTAGGLVATMLTALGIALLLGRRITESLEPLAALARSGAHAQPEATAPLPIREAEAARRMLRRALTDQADALEQARQLAQAKDEFLAMLAHELRNPLAAMRSATAVLGMPRVTPEAERRAREVLDRQVGHMVHMVDELLNAARLSGGHVALELRALDLAQAVRRVLHVFEQSGRTAQLRIETALAPVNVRADETRIEQIVSNLVDNAAKYARPGGCLRIGLRELHGMAELEFADDGNGLAPELLPRIFEPFSQGERRMDRAQGGLGLGLHVVKRLVELHGGSVQALSDGPDRGATFVVRLPAASPGDEPLARGETPLRLKPLRIALVEDNRDVEEMTGSLLRLAGHQVVCTADGEGAAALVQAQRSEVALVDIGLPGMDGLAVARRLRAQRGAGALVLIALTGYGDARTREAAARAGFDAFLQKPFELRSFEAAVRQAWSERGDAATAAEPDQAKPA
jgi:signal transduction histidine kinase/ActR/RegA family two-component response regulator